MGYSVILEAEISDPPGFYFGPHYCGDDADQHVLVGEGGFFVSRTTGQIRQFGSGEFGLAAAAARKETAAYELAVVVSYLLRYSHEELHRRAGHQKLPRGMGWTVE